MFTMRVGNILPGERVSVRADAGQPLPYEDGEATFRFPLVVAPRYIPGDAARGDSPVGDGTPPTPTRSPTRPGSRRRCCCPASRTRSGWRSSRRHRPGRPAARRRSAPACTRSSDRGRHAYGCSPASGSTGTSSCGCATATDDLADSLVLVPERRATRARSAHRAAAGAASAPPRPRDVVLLLDRSGSMGGWKMVAARRAAARIVDTLTGGDRFAVLTFDDAIDRPAGLPDGLVEAGRPQPVPRGRAPRPGGRTRRHRDAAPRCGRRSHCWSRDGDARRPRCRRHPGHRRAGRQRGPDPAGTAPATCAGAGAHGRHRPGRQRRLPRPAGRRRRRAAASWWRARTGSTRRWTPSTAASARRSRTRWPCAPTGWRPSTTPRARLGCPTCSPGCRWW